MSHSEASAVERARELRPFLRERAPETERNRRIGPEIVAALDQAGILDASIPRRWGGAAASALTIARIGAELGAGCPSTAWVYWVLSTGTWLASVAPDIVQEDVFGATRPRFCGSGKPGRAEPVEDGYRVSGRWDYCSGCHNANWGMFSVEVAGAEGPGARGRVFVPMDMLTIVESWDSVGMAGTGSHTAVANDIFVPRHRVVLGPMPLGPADENQCHFGEASDYWPALSVLRATMLGPLVGTAEAMLEMVTARAQARGFQFTTYTRQADAPVAQLRIAKAATQIEAARLLMERGAILIDEAAAARRVPEHAERCQLKGQAALVVEMLTEAGGMLMRLAGSSAFDAGNPLQRYWRDLAAAVSHANLLPDIGFEIYGRSLLGVAPNLVPGSFV